MRLLPQKLKTPNTDVVPTAASATDGKPLATPTISACATRRKHCNVTTTTKSATCVTTTNVYQNIATLKNTSNIEGHSKH